MLTGQWEQGISPTPVEPCPSISWFEAWTVSNSNWVSKQNLQPLRIPVTKGRAIQCKCNFRNEAQRGRANGAWHFFNIVNSRAYIHTYIHEFVHKLDPGKSRARKPQREPLCSTRIVFVRLLRLYHRQTATTAAIKMEKRAAASAAAAARDEHLLAPLPTWLLCIVCGPGTAIAIAVPRFPRRHATCLHIQIVSREAGQSHRTFSFRSCWDSQLALSAEFLGRRRPACLRYGFPIINFNWIELKFWRCRKTFMASWQSANLGGRCNFRFLKSKKTQYLLTNFFNQLRAEINIDIDRFGAYLHVAFPHLSRLHLSAVTAICSAFETLSIPLIALWTFRDQQFMLFIALCQQHQQLGKVQLFGKSSRAWGGKFLWCWKNQEPWKSGKIFSPKWNKKCFRKIILLPPRFPLIFWIVDFLPAVCQQVNKDVFVKSLKLFSPLKPTK